MCDVRRKRISKLKLKLKLKESFVLTNDILLRSTYILLSQPVSVELKTKF
jgi:hypothetical protein